MPFGMVGRTRLLFIIALQMAVVSVIAQNSQTDISYSPIRQVGE